MKRLLTHTERTVSLVHLAVAVALLTGCAGPAKGTRLPPSETAISAATATPLPTATPTIAPTATSLPTAPPSSSPSLYSEWVRTSQYVTVRDGTKLAVDIFRPTQAGKPVQDPLPVIWAYERFQRAAMVQGRPFTELDRFPYLTTLLQHGYVVAAADARGSGASFGTSPGLFNPQEILDTYDLTEWFAAQPWCNNNVGMFGKGYAGSMQYLAASAAPPHLKAIMPEMAPADVYALIYPGGVIHDALISALSFNMKNQDRLMPAMPVDQDRDGSLRDAAVKQHTLSSDVSQIAWGFPYRNSADKATGISLYLNGSPLSYIKQISLSQVPIYHIVGWFDLFTRDGFLMFNALDNPQKLFASSWEWEAENSLDFTNERLRWYDYWLKGIPNGIMDEPPIRYFTMSAARGSAEEWQLARQWPLPGQKMTPYYFQSGSSASVKSLNDGVLDIQPPKNAAGQDDYVVDYTTSSGQLGRWTTAGSPSMDYGDMTGNDEKGLTFTTLPLVSDFQMTGHPIAHLWVASTAKDADFFVYLEDVSDNGYSRYVTEGVLRASHRAATTTPYGDLDLPYHRSYKEDIADLPAGGPVELVLDLFPTSNNFRAGHRIRVTITGADSGNAQIRGEFPPPTITLYRDAQHASYISLPIIPTKPDQAKPSSAPTAATPSSQQPVVSVSNHLNYLLYLPKGYGTELNKKWPLILFLHGGGEVGNDLQDLERVKKHPIPKNLEQGTDLPFIVISPQLPTYALWESQLDHLNGLLDEVIANYAVDVNRIYLTGLSRGGSGTWNMAIKYPRFAAIAPIASYGDPTKVCALTNVPVWAFHNTGDTMAPIQSAEQMVSALRSCGGDVQFTIYQSNEHDSWTQAYANPDLYKWFLSHSRGQPAAATPLPAGSPTVKP